MVQKALQTNKYNREINVGVGINFLRGNEDGSLVAAVCDDLVVRVYDVDLNRLVRHYSGHLNKITDLAFRFLSFFISYFALILKSK